MTQNQIAWQNAKENVRHNQVSEREQIRHNKQDEGLRQSELAETVRHQMRTEDLTSLQQQEQVRHNFASEAISHYQAGAAYANVGELSRHNTVQEAQGWITTAALAGLQNAQAEKARSEVGVQQYSATSQKTHWDKQDQTAFFNLGIADSNATSQRKQAEAHQAQADAATQQADTAAKKQATDAAQGWVSLILKSVDQATDVPVKASQTLKNLGSLGSQK